MEIPYYRVAATGDISRFLSSFHMADQREGDIEIVSPPTGYPILGHVFRGFCGASVEEQPPQSLPLMPFNVLAGQLYRKAATVRWSGGIGYAVAEFTATGLWELLHLDATKVTNGGRPLTAVDPAIDRALTGAVDRLGPGPAAFETVLTPLIASARTAPPFVAEAACRIEAAAGNIRLGELCQTCGVSGPTLSKWFRQVVGLPPKYFARVVQFNHVGALVMAGDHQSLAQLAAEAGFYDQAHFTRVVQEFVLMNPATFLASDFTRISTFVRLGGHVR